MTRMWWQQIYRFEPAYEDGACTDPHQGQVIYYYRKLRKRSHHDVAMALGWSAPEAVQCESRPDGPGAPARRRAIGAFLRIPSFLLGLPGEQGTPGFAREDTLPDPEEATLRELMPFLAESEPMSEEALWLWGHALDGCTHLFRPLEPQDHPSLTDAERQMFLIDAKQAERNTTPTLLTTSTEQVRLGLDSMDYWLDLLQFAAARATGARRVQYLYLEQQFACIASATIHLAQNSGMSPKRWLEYDTRALGCAQELEHAELIATSLIMRAGTFLEQGQDTLALHDIEEALFSIKVESAVFVGGGRSAVFDLRELLRLAEGRTNTRLRTLLDEAMRIAQVTHDDL
jgi:hypothetical protein